MEELLLKPATTTQVWKLVILYFFLSFCRPREAPLHRVPWEDFESKTAIKSVHFNTTTDTFHFINNTFD